MVRLDCREDNRVIPKDLVVGCEKSFFSPTVGQVGNVNVGSNLPGHPFVCCVPERPVTDFKTVSCCSRPLGSCRECVATVSTIIKSIPGKTDETDGFSQRGHDFRCVRQINRICRQKQILDNR